MLDPLLLFFIVISVLVVVPNLVEKIKIPAIVGLMLVGMLIGPNGLGILEDGRALEVLATIGMVYLMFIAGLEIHPEQFWKVKFKSLRFGLLTFGLPLIAGFFVGRLFGYGILPSILIGSFYSSHTLISFPIIKNLGVGGNEPVAVVVGGTIFTDIGALVVLSLVVGTWGGDFQLNQLFMLLFLLTIYLVGSLFLIPKIGKLFFRLEKSFEHAEFHFVFFVLLASTLLSELIGVHAIVGAFIAGIAISTVLVERDEFLDKIFFAGDALFIPIFYIHLGLTADIPSLLASRENILMLVLFVCGLLFAKFLASYLSSKIFRYSFMESINMWGLSIPQVAATLAAAIVGRDTGIIAESTYNAVVVLSIVSSLLSPFITRISANKLIEVGIYDSDTIKPSPQSSSQAEDKEVCSSVNM